MSNRTLLSLPKRGDSYQSRGTAFKLQAPPFRIREKRKGRLYSRLDEEDSIIHEEGTPYQSPFGRDDKIFQRRLIAETISPKSILHNDVRTEFPEGSHFEDDDSDGHGGYDEKAFDTVTNSTQNTPRAAGFTLPPLMASRHSSQATVTSDNSGQTVGTFGNLRRRSSSQTNRSSTTDTSSDDVHPCAIEQPKTPHIVVCLSPRSPLTPGKRDALHTPPSQACFSLLRLPDDGIIDVRSSLTTLNEPLSATLKRLGAARNSQNLDLSRGEQDSDYPVIQPIVASAWSAHISKRLGEQNEAKSALKQSLDANRLAAPILARKTVSPLRKPSDDDPHMDGFSITEQEEDDVVPSYLPGWGFVGSAPRTPARSVGNVQSTVRGAPHTSEADGVWGTVRHRSMSLASYIFGNHQRARTIHTDVFLPTEQASSAQNNIQPSSDGWGGLRPRSSWFPSLRLGPLLSPRSPLTHRSARLRSFRLCSGQDGHTHSTAQHNNDDNDWIDEPNTPHVPTTPHTPASVTILRRLRVRFPSQLPDTKRLRSEPNDEFRPPPDGLTVTYTEKSAEGRPLIRHVNLPRARKVFLSMIVIGVAGALTCVLVLLATGHIRRPPPHLIERNPVAHRRSMVLGAVGLS